MIFGMRESCEGQGLSVSDQQYLGTVNGTCTVFSSYFATTHLPLLDCVQLESENK